jgi:transposase-like protein
MTPALRPTSPEVGVTDTAVGPAAMAGSVRFLPPTAAEVGRAAALCFQDAQSDEQIARQLGIVRRTLARWKKRGDFAAAIAALQAWQELAGEAPGIDASARRAAPRRRSREDISREASC